MAAKNVEHTKTDVQETGNSISVSVKQKDAIYTINELAKNAEDLFGTSPDCVYAALKQKGITECTKTKASEIVKAFRGRKVE